jgi:two-component system NarL family sensor kinase
MNLRSKIVALAVAPLLVALLLVATAVWYQERDLAARERALVERTLLAQRRSELRSYVELAVSTVKPLYDAGLDDDRARDEALRRLAALDYGDDGYFFVYDLRGRSLMHSRQHDLEGQDLWGLTDSKGRRTIQDLIGRAVDGGGYVEYEWRKPSSAQRAPKLGYVTALPRWGWMLGTGLYLDDVELAMRTLQDQVRDNVTTTMLWIAVIAAACLGVVSAGGLLLNLSEHRVAEARLRLLARRVVRSQEDERAHLARELHDGVSQTLVSAKLLIESGVDALERADRTPPPALAKALLRLNDSLAEVRRLSHRLRPALLDTLGLPAALEHLGAEFDADGALRVEVAVRGDSPELLRRMSRRRCSASRRRRSPTCTSMRGRVAWPSCWMSTPPACAWRSATTARVSMRWRWPTILGAASACATCASAWMPSAASSPCARALAMARGSSPPYPWATST